MWGWLSTYLSACFPKSIRAYMAACGEDTWRVIWLYICQSFQALYDGVRPTHDPYGHDWPAGSDSARLAGTGVCGGASFGALWNIATDAEYACNEFKVAHYSSNYKCNWCRADKWAHNYRAVGATAPWIPTIYSIDREPPLPPHPVWALPGVTRWHYMGDLMHNNFLGVDLHVLGGTIKELTDAGGPYMGNESERFNGLWEDFQRAYGTLDITNRLPEITKKSLANDAVGVLKASKDKETLIMN